LLTISIDESARNKSRTDNKINIAAVDKYFDSWSSHKPRAKQQNALFLASSRCKSAARRTLFRKQVLELLVLLSQNPSLDDSSSLDRRIFLRLGGVNWLSLESALDEWQNLRRKVLRSI
jgi:hypothetical protein